MEAYIVDWLSLLGRWLHMITGIAWIGASFYFVWLDNHLEPCKDPADTEKGVGGELWSIHGGGFYHAQKYKVSPAQLPDQLHWFKWEAYSTWISGVFLMSLLYWYGAQIYTIDPAVMELSVPVAVAIGVGTLVFGWFVYDLLCKSPLGGNDKVLGLAVFVFVSIAAYGLCQVFSGRGAYMHFGAMLGTIMVANVFFVITPGHRAIVAAVERGDAIDPKPGITAKQRSVHNTYFTLPVLFIMISNHYAMLFGHEYNWVLLLGMTVAGALIRIYFVQRHFGNKSPVPFAAATAILLAIIITVAPKPVESVPGAPEVAFADVQSVIDARCAGCHAAKPTMVGWTAAPKGIMLDNAARIVSLASQIHQQTVVSKAMPIANMTQITDAERDLIDQWFRGGAKGE